MDLDFLSHARVYETHTETWPIVDRVVIPEGTPPGEYVLGWRAFRCCLLYVGRAATMMTARVLFVAAFAARLNDGHALLGKVGIVKRAIRYGKAAQMW